MEKYACAIIVLAAACSSQPQPEDVQLSAFANLGEMEVMSALEDGAGNVYVLGRFTDELTLGADTYTSVGEALVVAKLGPSDQVMWSRVLAGNGNDFEMGTGVALDSTGALVVVGQVSGDADIDFGEGPLDPATNSSSPALFVAKYDASGAHLWSLTTWATSTAAIWPSPPVVDSADNIVFSMSAGAGTIDLGGGAVDTAGVYLVKLDAAGALVFQEYLHEDASAPLASNASVPPVAVTPDDEILVSASLDRVIDLGAGPLGPESGHGHYLAKYSSSGALLFARDYPAPDADVDSWLQAHTLEVAPSGEIVMAGYYAILDNGEWNGGALGFARVLTPDGDETWLRQFDSSAYHGPYTPLNRAALTADGEIVVFGDNRIRGYDLQGETLFTHEFDQQGTDTPKIWSIASSARHDVLLAGAFREKVGFAGQEVGAGEILYDGFLLRYNIAAE